MPIKILFRWIGGLGGVTGLVATAATTSASLPYYVSDFANVSSFTGGNAILGNDSHSYTSGNLLQKKLVNSTSAASVGGTYLYNWPNLSDITTIYQTSSAFVNDEADLGALHVNLRTNTDSGLISNPGPPPFDPGQAKANADDTVMWSDTVSFGTQNPLGSDFTLALNVDDSIAAAGTNFPTEIQGGYNGSVVARIDFSSSSFADLGFSQDLVVQDTYIVARDGTVTSQMAANHAPSVTVHIARGSNSTVTITGTLRTAAGSLNGTGFANVDAGDTALFTVNTPDPLASYADNSGTIFATSVPEPAAMLAAAAIAIHPLMRRRANPM